MNARIIFIILIIFSCSNNKKKLHVHFTENGNPVKNKKIGVHLYCNNKSHPNDILYNKKLKRDYNKNLIINIDENGFYKSDVPSIYDNCRLEYQSTYFKNPLPEFGYSGASYSREINYETLYIEYKLVPLLFYKANFVKENIINIEWEKENNDYFNIDIVQRSFKMINNKYVEELSKKVIKKRNFKENNISFEHGIENYKKLTLLNAYSRRKSPVFNEEEYACVENKKIVSFEIEIEAFKKNSKVASKTSKNVYSNIYILPYEDNNIECLKDYDDMHISP